MMTSPLTTPGGLTLRPLRLEDEAEFLAAHRTMLDDCGFAMALSWEDGMHWHDYVSVLNNLRRGVDVPEGLVPAALLVADVDGTIVGRTSIRFELNDYLAYEGGHIGYGVLPAHRRKGHATEILRQSLVIIRGAGVRPSLVCCDDDNAASARVIESNGGQLEAVVQGPSGAFRRYWVA